MSGERWELTQDEQKKLRLVRLKCMKSSLEKENKSHTIQNRIIIKTKNHEKYYREKKNHPAENFSA